MTTNTELKSLVAHWTYDHFVAFLLLYASYADLELTEDERVHIGKITSQTIYEEALVVFNKFSDFQQLQIILDLKNDFILTDEDKGNILKLLVDHFHKDGEFSRLENSLYEFLKRLL